jgi:hypothetical protein
MGTICNEEKERDKKGDECMNNINESSGEENKNEIDYYNENKENLEDKNMVIYREKKMKYKNYLFLHKNNISFIIHRNNGMNDYIIALNLQKINKSNII